ncbi:MAG: hypothetical protein CEN89_32 [Candidatus Berkelbacteria bacterium Licking1014_7]|uniref:Uncharacterized protein n=1 Tax=Candidatus Berkelbacteria bacterium Licking1014_7 TaxID=2017147 RepID=A0A554LKT7_9BACT|nr:MAG: hypothetical protein CEN89_32 [Candidatus Berkelbacteria bacterium Licking1014_7]
MNTQNLANNQDTAAPAVGQDQNNLAGASAGGALTDGQSQAQTQPTSSQVNASIPPADEISTEDILNKDILELMGAKNMPEEKKQVLYQKMMATIKNRAMQRVFETMPEQDLDEWKRVLEAGDQAQIDQFLIARKIDVKKFFLQEAMIYKIEMAGITQEALKQSQNKQ